jgi:hypothetical protein
MATEKGIKLGISPAICDRKRKYRATFSQSCDKPKSLIRALPIAFVFTRSVILSAISIDVL